MKYIIDSNCFVTPHRSFCPTDVGISFWNKIQTLAKEGKIYSLDKVKEELYSNSDDLKKWLEATINDRFFIEFTQAHSIHKLATIIQWASTNEFYTEKAKRKFLNMEKARRSCYNNSKAKGGKDDAKSYNIYFDAAGFAGSWLWQ